MGKRFQRLKLPQRILLVFMLCVLMPLIVMLSLSLSRMKTELEEKSFQELRHQTKNAAMSIMERLLDLESEMRFFISIRADSSKEKEAFLAGPSLVRQSKHFDALIHRGPGGSTTLFGESDGLWPPIPPGAHDPGRPEKPVLMPLEVPQGVPVMFMAVALSDSEWVVGRINSGYLWNAESNFNLPPDTEICILGDSDTVLTSSLADPSGLVRAVSAGSGREHFSRFFWQHGPTSYLASAYRLFVEASFKSKPWIVVLNRSQKSILSSVQRFRTNLYLVGLLVILIVFFFSMVSIRRSLKPLNSLVARTESLGCGDFSQKAAVHGSPEFRELAEAFNRMIVQIENQFEALSESEERFRAAFDNSAAGAAIVGPEGRFVKVNPFFSAMLGFSQEELLAKRLQELIHPDVATGGELNPRELLDGTQSANPDEKRFVHKDGRILIGLVSRSPLNSRADRSLHILHMLDITAQKKAQIESENLEKQLIHAQKMEAIGTLAAGISHDFNNILSGIMGYTELALLQAPEGSALRERLEKIRDGSQRAANLVRQILAFSRREENKMGPVQLSSIIKEALKLLSSSLPPHISIVQDISSEPLSVNADPTQIHQLIMNLCTNAYHAMMESAAGTLEVTLRPEQVHDSGADKARTYLTLRIRDTGCGMTPEVQARIFEPYFTTKQKGLGTGLGLSIVHTVVKKHHGDLRVTSMPGCGSAFEIRFPAVEQGGGLKSQTRQALPTGSERILIVDDEKDVAAIWRQMLIRQGYQVESRNDPIQALMDFRRAPDRYDLMVTDQAMPGMTGVMLAEELTRIRPGFPVILCTGYFEEMRNIPRCPSIREHLTKPVNLTTLAQTVRRVIDRAAQGHRIPPRISGPKSRLMAPYAEPPEA